MTLPVLDGPKNEIGDDISKNERRINFDRLVRECFLGKCCERHSHAIPRQVISQADDASIPSYGSPSPEGRQSYRCSLA
jgi:hypothetical protein